MDNQRSLDLPRSLENLAKGLLATTCLTVACGTSAAVAGTITEPIGAFPNSSPGYLLPAGTTVVDGYAGQRPGESGNDSPDWFEFQGLTPGDKYTLSAVYDPFGPRNNFQSEMGSGNGESGLEISLFTRSQSALFTNQSMEGPGAMLMGAVPADGFLDVKITSDESAGSYYQVTLAQTPASTGTPEPGTVATVGLALAGALAWRRKRRK